MNRNNELKSLLETPVARRTVFKGIAAAGTASLLTSCSSSTQKTLTISDFGGTLSEAYKEAFYDEFESETGVKIKVAPTVTMGALKAQAESSSPTWDLVENSPYFMILAGKAGYLEKIDYDRIPAASGSSIDADARFEYSMGYNSYSDVVGWNTQSIQGQPTGWADMWDVKRFPGKRSYISYPDYGALEQPLLAEGMSFEEIYSTLSSPDMKGIQRSLDSLKNLAPHIGQWWTYGAQPVSALADGSAAMAYAWSGRIAPLKRAGAPVDFTYNDGIIVLDSLAVVKGSKNSDLAHQFINFTLDKKRQARLAELTTYGPVNQDAYSLIDDDTLKYVNTAPENKKLQMVCDQNWTAEYYSVVTREYTSTLAAFEK
jgi:putative spermidine/putrescine transport system substrate-binding protein